MHVSSELQKSSSFVFTAKRNTNCALQCLEGRASTTVGLSTATPSGGIYTIKGRGNTIMEISY